MTGVVRFLAFGVLSFVFLFSLSAKVLGGRRSRCPALTAGPRTSVRGSAVWGQDWRGVFIKSGKTQQLPWSIRAGCSCLNIFDFIHTHYQLLSGHAATGDYLCNRIHKLSPDKCWWCSQDERSTHHRLFVNCAAWRPKAKELWKDVGYLCGWKHPRAPRMALLFGDEMATKAVLSFLRKTNVGQMVTVPPRDEEEERGEGEEGWPGHPTGHL